MNPTPSLFMILKLGIVTLFLIGVFVLAALGRIDATAAIAAATGGIGALVVALGISASGSARAAAALRSAGLADVKAAPPVRPAGFGTLRVLVVLAVVGVAVSTLCRCTPAQAATTQKIVQTIVQDLQAGASDGQMASDVCADLGGTAITDAVCAGATEIVADVVDMLINDGQLSSNPTALAAAQGYKSRHATTKRTP